MTGHYWASTRANAAVARQLRQFDRLASQLDAVERTLKALDATLARVRGVFHNNVDIQSSLARGTPLTSAARIAALEAARQRVDTLIGPVTSFRPLLIVSPLDTDTIADLDQKLTILAAEQARGIGALASMDRDLAVLDGRRLVTTRLLTDLDAAARSAPPDLRLVQRQVDEVQQRLRDLEAKRSELRRARDGLAKGLVDVEQQTRNSRARLAQLMPPGQ